MASETGPDMTLAREKVESLMDDSCIARFDPEGTADDVFNPATGYVEPPVSDTNIVYDDSTLGDGGRSLADVDGTGGKCKIKVSSQTEIARAVTEGGKTEGVQFFTVGLPWDAPALAIGTVITYVSSRRDPLLVGKPFRVRTEGSLSTFNVSRKYLCERRAAS